MELPFAIGLFVAALVLTYFTCIRPMRRGQGHCGTCAATEGMKGTGRQRKTEMAAHDVRQRAEIARLREDIESLKASRR